MANLLLFGNGALETSFVTDNGGINSTESASIADAEVIDVSENAGINSTESVSSTDATVIFTSTDDGGINSTEVAIIRDTDQITRSLATTVTLFNTKTITIDVETSVKWNAAFAREFSTINFNIPRSSPAFSKDYIDEDGGFLVRLQHPTLGRWTGIAGVPTIDSNGATIEATEIGILTTIRTVSTNKVFTGMTAGTIVRAAVLDATAGLSQSFLKAGHFLEAAPHIPQYTFTGQYLSEVLADMMEMTGQEWEIDVDGNINWIAVKSNVYSIHLCDDGDVIDGQRSGELSDVLAQVTTRTTQGNSATRLGRGQGYWVKQETISLDTGSQIVLSSEAQNSLDRRDEILQKYSVMLRETPINRGGNHWNDIREGDTLQLVLPYAGLEGNCPVVRVLSREYTTGDRYVKLELQYPAYVDRLNAARLITSTSIQVTEAPTPNTLADPCLNETVNTRTTTISSTSTVNVIGTAGDSYSEITVNINPIVNTCHSFYYIRYRRNGQTIYGYIPTYTTSAKLTGLVPNVTYEIGVASVGKSGVISAYSTDSSVAAANDTVAPATPTGVVASVGIMSLSLTWNAVADKDVAYYEIHRSTQGSDSGWSLIATVKGTFYRESFTGTSAVSYSYKVRAVDTSGNSGSLSSSSGLAATQLTLSGVGSGAITGGYIASLAITDSHINSLTASKITTGTLTSTVITLGSGGKIIDADGSYWDQSGIVLKGNASVSDSIRWQKSGTDYGYAWVNASNHFEIGGGDIAVGRPLDLTGSVITMIASISADFLVWSGNDYMKLGDSAGTYQFGVKGSDNNLKFGIASNGAVKVIANATNGLATGYTTLGTLIGRWHIFNDSGTAVGFIPIYDNIT